MPTGFVRGKRLELSLRDALDVLDFVHFLMYKFS